MAETDERGYVVRHEYDARGQRIATTYPDATVVRSEYDARGYETASIDQLGRRTEHEHDGAGRLVSVTDALGGVTRFGYDEAGFRTSQTDALGRVTHWTHDALGRELGRTLPMGQRESFTYDAAGNRLTHADFAGAVHRFVHDAYTDRLVQERFADGTVIEYGHDAGGRRVTARDARGTIAYAFDGRDRLVRETKPDGSSISYAYDEVGNRTELTARFGGTTRRTEYAFDAANRLISVTGASGGVTRYTRDAGGNEIGIAHANGTSTTRTIDAIGRVTRIVHSGRTGQTLARYDHTLDATGRRVEIVEASGRERRYEHDALYRLTGETVTDPVAGDRRSEWDYDAVGNRIYQSVDGSTTSYSYDDNDRLLTDGGTIYTYDARGNAVEKRPMGGLPTYNEYDGRNSLVATETGGLRTTFVHDPDGARIERSDVLDGTTTYLVDANRRYAQVLAEDTAGFGALGYTYGTGLVGLDRGSSTYTYHNDAQGSVRLLTDGTGSVVDDLRYDAWGEQLAGGAVADNVYRYTGERFDSAVDGYYLRARYYRPQLGRFARQDDWTGDPERPVTLNKYLYGNGDPTSYVDPTGYFGLASFGAASNIRATLGTMSVPQFSFVVNQAIGTTIKATGKVTTRAALKKLRQCIKKKNRCGLEFNLLVSGYDTPDLTDHIRSAQLPHTVVLTYIKNKQGSRTWYNNGGGQGGCKATLKPGAAYDCDEYPFFKTKEGGSSGWSVSLRWVPSWQNQLGGAYFGGLAGQMDTNDEFVVITSDSLPGFSLSPNKGRK